MDRLEQDFRETTPEKRKEFADSGGCPILMHFLCRGDAVDPAADRPMKDWKCFSLRLRAFALAFDLGHYAVTSTSMLLSGGA